MKKEKHPYYDSEQKKRTEDFAIKGIAWSIIGIIILMILATLTTGCREVLPKETDDTLFVPTEEDVMVLDTLYDMVKETEHDIDTLFHSIDRIEAKLDELIRKANEASEIDTFRRTQSYLENIDPDYMYMDTSAILDEGDNFALITYEDSEEDLDYYNSDEYLELWYTKIDTNSNGEPDNIEKLY